MNLLALPIIIVAGELVVAGLILGAVARVLSGDR